MSMFTTLPLFCTAPFSRQRIGLVAWLLWVLLLMAAAAQAWATPNDSVALRRENIVMQEDYDKVLRALALSFYSPASPQAAQESSAEVIYAIDAFPDVVVFPIWVAGPISAPATKTPASKIVQAPAAGTIAVIYPDIGEPYHSVFIQIIEGIEAKAKGRVINFAVGKNVDAGELNNSLRRQDARMVIALGWQGMKTVSALDSSIGAVAGGVLAAPENSARFLQVNSLSPDPALLFSRLKEIMPKARRVFTVYDPRQNAWMMRIAKEAAHAQGLELTAYEAQDLRSATRIYQEIFAAADSKQDALWLPQDSTTVEDGSVLPLVLQESWARNLAVFSSSFGHVRRGALFSLYPNNIELGRRLAGSALDMLASGENETSGVIPLREVLMAVNLRTAKHLGLNADHMQRADVAFPEK